ncbi:malonate decarboxylase holo-[acyl-carrier-protein] synthase [Burkholderia stagnalis]|uniref:malonate decarboxylase holo-[acyl-carrier-protein] synthase n=1 Tax=Burkholderia stagnalis TaxID=1503054 RepID=UPI00075D9DD6|nr:malonate decarboxylase holo-[acyl-carrier-protein] synthase [Burkholderia stagnalis]KWI34005.1 phosphoribosyl-dephospho-CoA transferase [Burkholderia stagnalis]KWI79395.1 phosphoribosyl-dephospho-CoA transferase [Burkholderia stagnalis]RQQ05302.1 malonate decarboxylase holo-[acyl-carrier-protein] synthase [Burkholderia stagnalis]RQQ19849.1 malonate decarboxylase holo-[acyl-carrier-protein] synthase [Burkholderia stagnalis]RQQ27541.1 malonate decarboxylase holo-[acyl-carrier-protein] synthas
MPRTDAPLRRHALVTLTAAGWAALLARDAALAGDARVRAWAARGWPLVVRRALPDEAGVPLGMPLPPSAGKRRVAICVDADALAAVVLPPAFANVLDAAPAAWRPTLRALDALGARCGVQGRVFGSLAWQALTGECYLTGTSDLDVLFPLPDAAQAATLLDGLAALDAAAPMRIDGELLRDDGAGVNWRELHAGLPEVAIKTAGGVALGAAAEFIAGVAQ